jgi:hypothetical protein
MVIGLVMADWVSLEGLPQGMPVPLARGEGHARFKAAVIEESDEVYLLVPLGKLFSQGVEEFNQDFLVRDRDHTRVPYDRIDIAVNKAKRVKLVTTVRTDTKSVLYGHSMTVRAHLGLIRNQLPDYQMLVDKPVGEVPHILIPFNDHASKSPAVQLEAELPHRESRRGEFREKYFSLPPTLD